MPNQSSSKWVLLPLQQPPVVSANTVIIPPGYTVSKSPEEIRKGQVMENLFQVGVIFKHKGSRVLWEVIGVVKNPDGSTRFGKLKSKKSGYVKYFATDSHSYDNLNLYEAPEALKILFGDQKHVKANAPAPIGDPQEAEQAFDVDLTKDQIE